MKKSILILAILLSAVTSFAQTAERKVTATELEIIVGTFDTFTTHAIEGRYNFRSPWDVGFRVNFDYFNAIGGTSPTTYDVVADYNFRQGKSISFFVGAGMGRTTDEWWDSATDATKSKTYFHFMPRAGVEFFNRARLTAYYNFFGDEYQTNGLGLSAGFVVGGSKIENRSRNVRHFEFEPSLGIATSSFINFSLEARYNFNRPWDVGVNASVDFNGFRITAVGDYHLLYKKRTTLYCGLGAGCSITDILNVDKAIEVFGDAHMASFEGCLCVYPRIGVELFERLRFTATVNTYNFKKAELLLSIGVAIGGDKE